jgi:hypothetical protein
METKNEIKNKLFLGVLVIFLILFAFSLGYFLGKAGSNGCVVQEIFMDPAKSELVNKRYFNIIGTVSQIAGRTLTLSAQNETMDIFIEETAIIKTFLSEQGEPLSEGPREVAFENIKIGDKVSVFVEERENKELKGTSVFIHFVPPAE